MGFLVFYAVNFKTSIAVAFQRNATELAQLRFGTDVVTAGWYTSVLQYAGEFTILLPRKQY